MDNMQELTKQKQPEPTNRESDKLRLVNFDKGKAGFALDSLTVTKVKTESQAYWKGVKPGWVILKVNGEGIHPDIRTLKKGDTVAKMLKAAIKEKYSVTFVLPEADAKHRARRSMSIPTGTRVKKEMQKMMEEVAKADAGGAEEQKTAE